MMDARRDYTRQFNYLSPFAGREFDRTGPDETADAIAILRALHAEPDPADVVNFTDEIDAITRLQERVKREIEIDAEWLGSDTTVNLPIGDQINLLIGSYDLSAEQRDFLQWERETKQTRESDRPY